MLLGVQGHNHPWPLRTTPISAALLRRQNDAVRMVLAQQGGNTCRHRVGVIQGRSPFHYFHRFWYIASCGTGWNQGRNRAKPYRKPGSKHPAHYAEPHGTKAGTKPNRIENREASTLRIVRNRMEPRQEPSQNVLTTGKQAF